MAKLTVTHDSTASISRMHVKIDDGDLLDDISVLVPSISGSDHYIIKKAESLRFSRAPIVAVHQSQGPRMVTWGPAIAQCISVSSNERHVHLTVH